MRASLFVAVSLSSLVVVSAGCTFSDVIAEGEPEGEGEGDVGEGEGDEGEGDEGEGEGDVGRVFACESDSAVVADASCAVAADCTTTIVRTDCCGSSRATGIAVDDVDRFNADYATCNANQPICDCIPGDLAADDGSVDVGDPVTVDCLAGRCVSSFGDGDRSFVCAVDEGDLAVEASCVNDDDCAFAAITLDCCGSEAVTGVAASAQRAIVNAEDECDDGFPDCDCLAEAPVADDGSTGTFGASPDFACVDGRCTTSFAP